jgi:hypothetical protein
MKEPKYKVGDRVCRLVTERYLDLAPLDSPMWFGTLKEFSTYTGLWTVITDSGVRKQWSPENFRKLTKLEKALQ